VYAAKWNKFQGIVDIYRYLRNLVSKNYNAKNVTNAWLKYYEIYSEYGLVKSTDTPQLVFFNAELPGAALCAYNHYAKTHGIKFEWIASSLMPSAESSALEDKFGLMRLNRHCWLMRDGSNDNDASNGNNGDMTNIANILDYEARVRAYGGVDFYSHDAGVDVSSIASSVASGIASSIASNMADASPQLKFNQQEELNLKIHLGCAITGFVTLKRGGNFVAKQYTYFETLSWNLILVYASLFETFYLCKPLTSRMYNSEIYLIGKNFLGFNPAARQLLFNKLTNFDMKPLFEPGVHWEAIANLQEFAGVVFGQQINSLNENVKLFEEYADKLHLLEDGIGVLKSSRIKNWFKNYPVKIIANVDQLKSR